MERWRKPWKEKDPRTGNWNVRWRERNADGELVKRSVLVADFKDACTKCDKLEVSLKERASATTDPTADLLVLLDRYLLDRERVKRLRPGAMRIKRDTLGRYTRVTPLVGDITRDALIKYRDDLLSAVSPVTAGIHLREVKAFVRWLWHEGKLENNPFFNIDMPRNEPTPRFLTDDELIKLEGTTRGPFKAIFRMAYLTGMRQTEILTAKWEDITWALAVDHANPGRRIKRPFITVLATTAKNRRSRTIPLRWEVMKLIGTKGKGRIFEGWDKSKVRWAWDCAKAQAGFTQRIRFHDLRHTFCRLYLQGGGTIADLMSLTGHQSLVMMQVYAHFETRWKSERMDALNLPASLSTGQSTGQPQDTDANWSVIEGATSASEVTHGKPLDDDKSASTGAVS